MNDRDNDHQPEQEQPAHPRQTAADRAYDTSDPRIKPSGWLSQAVQAASKEGSRITMLVELDEAFRNDPVLQPLLKELRQLVRIPGMPPIANVAFSLETTSLLLQSKAVISIQPDPVLKALLDKENSQTSPEDAP